MSSQAVENLLNDFDRMTADEQREAIHAILQRASCLDIPDLDDETINRIADESFLEYDARESADAEG